MAKFRFFPDPDEWARIVREAIVEGDKDALEVLRIAIVERDRQLEDYLENNGAGGSGDPGPAEGDIGFVVSYDPATLHTEVNIDGRQVPVRNYTNVNLEPQSEVVVISIPGNRLAAVGYAPYQPGFTLAAAPVAEGMEYLTSEYVAGSVSSPGPAKYSGPRWTIDDANLFGMGAGALVTGGPRYITIYDVNDPNVRTQIDFWTIGSGAIHDLRFWGGRLYVVSGPAAGDTATRRMWSYNFTTAAWTDLGNVTNALVAPYRPPIANGYMWKQGSTSLQAISEATGAVTNVTALSSLNIVVAGPTHTWACDMNTGDLMVRPTTVDTAVPFIAVAGPKWFDHRAVVSATGNLLWMDGDRTFRGGTDLRIVTPTGEVASHNVFPAELSLGRPVVQLSTVYEEGDAMIVGGARWGSASSNGGVWLGTIWRVSPSGASELWNASLERTPYTGGSSVALPTVGAGGLHVFEQFGRRYLRWTLSEGTENGAYTRHPSAWDGFFVPPGT